MNFNDLPRDKDSNVIADQVEFPVVYDMLRPMRWSYLFGPRIDKVKV